MRRVSSLAAIAIMMTLAGSLVMIAPAQADPAMTTLSVDTFQGATTVSPNWMKPSGTNVACLTASSNTGQQPIPGCRTPAIDPAGSGALRLTPAITAQVGTVYSTVSLPTAQGLSIKFNSYQYGSSSRADGIAFILAATNPANPSAPATSGPPGGALGYGTGASLPGVAYGYLGFGLDVYGNYVNRSAVGGSNCTGDQAASGLSPNSIGVRGPGNGMTGYCMLARTTVSATLGQGLDKPSDATRPAGVPVEIALNPSASPATTEGGLTVAPNSWAMRVTPYDNIPRTLTGTLPSMSGIAPASWLDGSGRPYQLTFGWAGSTGGSTEVHEINTLAAETVNGKLPKYVLAATDNRSGQFLAGDQAVVSVTPSLDASEGAEAEAATVTTTFPAGIVPQSGTFTTNGYSCTTAGQVVTCTYQPATPVLAGASMPAAAIPVTVPSATAPGSYTISAKVSSIDANPATTTHTVSVSRFTAVASGNITYGANETLSVTGLPAGATGSVTFTDADDNALCTIADVTLATSCVVTSPTAGTYPVTATYNPGVTSPYASQTATTGFVVAKAGAPFVAQASPTAVDYGTTSTLSALGLPAGATGTVTFSEGGNELCTAELPTINCVSPTGLPAGGHTLTATYSGDANHNGSTATTSLTVEKAGTVLTAAVADPSISYGGSTTLSYGGLAVTGPTAATGTVTFTDADDNVLCTATLPATSCTTSTSLPVGSYEITATYSGDGNHDTATADPVALEVTKAPITLSGSAASGDITYGDTDTLSYSGLTLSGPTAATGTVTFTDADDNVLCTVTLPATSCVTSDSLAAGTYQVTATYSGDGNHQSGSSDTFSLTVGTRGTTGMTAAVSSPSVVYGTPDTLSYAGLPLTGSTAATGTVTFTDADDNVLCTATLPATSCQTPDDLPAGTYAVTATYSGDSNHDGTTATTSFEVTRADTTLTAAVSSPSVVYGTPDTLSYAGLPLTGSTAATGTVTFTDADADADDNVLCTATLPATSCQTPDDLPAGTYAVTATYSGDSNHDGTTATTSFEVTKADTGVSLVPTGGTYGTALPLAATGLPPAATGTVTFTDADDNVLCTATLPDVSCQAPAGLGGGTHTVTVRYSGDDNHAPSTASGDVVVARAAFPLTATVSVPTATVGQPVTITVTGVPSDASGTVRITSNGETLCTFDLPATSCLLPTTLTDGDHPLLASYLGDDNYEPATATTALAVIPVPHDSEEVSVGSGSGRTVSVPVPSGPGITVTIVEGPEHGTAEIVDGRLVYTPDRGFVGTDTVTYLVEYPDGSTRLVTVTLVSPATDRPELPITGAMTGPLLAAALALLAGGVVLVLVRRRRTA